MKNIDRHDLAVRLANLAYDYDYYDFVDSLDGDEDMEDVIARNEKGLKDSNFIDKVVEWLEDEVTSNINWIHREEGKLDKRTRDIYNRAVKLINDLMVYQRDNFIGEIEESLKEDTVKQGSHWVNKGKEGTHGKFKTKKAADAQRRAMFTNSGKNRNFGEGLNESLYNIFYDYEDEYGYTYRDNMEEFEGDWHELQEYIKSMRRNGCYNIDAVWVRDNVRESCSRKRR